MILIWVCSSHINHCHVLCLTGAPSQPLLSNHHIINMRHAMYSLIFAVKGKIILQWSIAKTWAWIIVYIPSSVSDLWRYKIGPVRLIVCQHNLVTTVLAELFDQRTQNVVPFGDRLVGIGLQNISDEFDRQGRRSKVKVTVSNMWNLELWMGISPEQIQSIMKYKKTGWQTGWQTDAPMGLTLCPYCVNGEYTGCTN